MSILSHVMMILLMIFIIFSLDLKSKKWYIETAVKYFSFIAIVVVLGIGYINDYMVVSVAYLFGTLFWELRDTKVRMDNLQSEIVFLVGEELKEVIREKR